MFTKQWLWRGLSLALVVLMTLSPVIASPASVVAQANGPRPSQVQSAQKVGMSAEDVMGKIHPDLRTETQAALAKAGPNAVAPEPVLVQVIMRQTSEDFDKEGMPDFGAFFSGKPIVRPVIDLGELKLQFVVGQINPVGLPKLAERSAVWAILPVKFEQTGSPDTMPADDAALALAAKDAEDWALLRQNADKLRADAKPWAEAKAFGDGRAQVTPNDWFEAMPQGPHKAEAAWNRGFTGEGVSVAINDDGVDFAHPDLMGTQKIVTDPLSPYAGWPEVFSPFSQLAYAYEIFLDEPYISGGYDGVHFVDTSYKPRLYPCDAEVPGTRCFTFTPLIDFLAPGDMHVYRIDTSMTKSGVIHTGTHPDNDLRDFLWGEKPAVLVTDPNIAGVYDTVYVDLNNDYDFRDEKPLTKADITSPATLDTTYNNMVAYRDLNFDGKADVSGGMLYFIADGSLCPPAMDYMWGCGFNFAPPANGDIVAFEGGTFDRPYSHGTQCASNVAGQGVVNALLPEYVDLAPTPGAEKPAAAIRGMAPDAKIVAVADIYYNFEASKIDAYLFNTMGYDGYFGSGDEQHVTSNSYGASDQDNDGWDYDGQFISQLNMLGYAPYTQFMFSTGNGAPGYGTAAPPSPATGIAVGASTEFGSTGWDSIAYLDQIMFNDVIPWSNRGPGASGTSGVDVVAGGAYAAGAEELNYYAASTWGVADGNLSWVSWGGTSRSTPVAAGVMALLYQAFNDDNGYYPDYETAKALLKSSASDLNYDTFVQGSGSVNADTGSLVASGEFGTFTTPTNWVPGDYRGEDYPLFAHIAYPGESYTQTFTVNNPSDYPMTVGLTDEALVKVGQESFDYTITPTMFANKGPLNPLKAPQYIIPLTAEDYVITHNNWWDNISIPNNTDLMIVRMNYPYDQFDPNDDLYSENIVRLTVYNWKDVNHNYSVWNDTNANGLVDFEQTDEYTIDVLAELDWANSELEQHEYGRFSYLRSESNQLEVLVRNPSERMLDGLFIGLAQSGSVTTTDLHFEIDFYQNQPVDWISTPPSVVVPANDTAEFVATVDVPADLAAGMYEAAIKVQNPPVLSYQGYTSVVPVTLVVAADFDTTNQFGGVEQQQADADKPYNNAAVRGTGDWGWRNETGDWRFFFMDIKNTPTATADLVLADFEAGIPVNWTVLDNAGDGLDWFASPNNLTGGSGNSAYAKGWYGNLDTELRTPTFDLDTPGHNGAFVNYKAFYNNYAGLDYLDLDLSLDGGLTWKNLSSWNEDHGVSYMGYAMGETINIDLSAYMGMQDLMLRWHYYDPNGIADDWYAMVDEVRVFSGEFPYPESAHVIVRDVWDSAGPHTDLDTIVLGPSPTRGDLPDGAAFPEYMGPYTLETVARSQDTNVGAGRWDFQTSSGGPEEWVSFPLNDGLHEILQHAVMWEGDNIWVPFTKTVGMLTEDKHFFDIQTYVDQGLVGKVNLQSTLDLDQIVTDAFLVETDDVFLDDEPLPLSGWTGTFEVENAFGLEISTSSADVSDLDLVLLYCYDPECDDADVVASSAGSSSDEYVSIANPADGTYMIYIDNYSQQVGHFDLLRVVQSKVAGLNVTLDNTGNVPANTNVELEITYDYALEPGKTYEGLVFVGIPQAPQLKQIPITIQRLDNSSAVMKSVDKAVSGADEQLIYTINLYNMSDPAAVFHFEDPIPAGTSYVSHTPGSVTYDSNDNKLVYDGTLPLATVVPQVESVEHAGALPDTWRSLAFGDVGEWEVLYGAGRTGDYAFFHDWNSLDADSRLISNYFDVTPADFMASFYIKSDTTWPGADVLLYALMPSGAGYPVWSMQEEQYWPDMNSYRQVTVDLSDFEGDDMRLMWRYLGMNGQVAYLDDISLPGMSEMTPSLQVKLTVLVDSDLVDGDVIVNEATLDVEHSMPQETQVEPAVTHEAVTTIGVVDLSTSYKTATAGMYPGGYINYEVHIINSGTAPALGVTLSDALPAGVTYTHHFGGTNAFELTYDNLGSMWWAGTVMPGEEVVLYFTVKLDSAYVDATVDNTAVLSWAATDWNLEASTIVQHYKLYAPLMQR